MSNHTPFLSGEDVEYNGVRSDLTKGKIYKVISICGEFLRIINDSGVCEGYLYKKFTLYTGSQTAVTAVPKRANPHGQRTPKELAAVLAGSVDDEDTYDTRKANARVTSVGQFEAGTVVVYKDGTVTLTSLTVKWCTATCVQFEETYSAAFDPNEFTVEY